VGGFRRVASIIQGSRPTPDFEVAPLGPRSRRFLWEVMLQAKVIEQRPLPGWRTRSCTGDFSRFSLITLNHLATPLGGRFSRRTPDSAAFYYGFVAVWAVVVAISIRDFSWRRFFVRPVWLGNPSPEFGLYRAADSHVDAELSGRVMGRR